MGSTEQSINEEEVFDRTCGRNVQKKPIYRRGPGDSGMTQEESGEKRSVTSLVISFLKLL